MFGLVNKRSIMGILSDYVRIINKQEGRFKMKFKNKEITEWEYYKVHHELKGRFSMIEDFELPF